MSKYVCSICGYTHEGEAAPDKCPICKAPKQKFIKAHELTPEEEERVKERLQEQSQQDGKETNIFKKYGLYVLGALLFFYILGQCGGSSNSSDSKESQQTEQKQEASAEQTQTKKESNPYAKFVGKYVLYDDEGGKGQRFIVAPDGRFLQDHSFDESNYKVCGNISPKNDNQFEVSLDEEIFSIKSVWSYKNNQTCMQRWDISYNNTLLFDINEKRMYIDIKEYNNRDYTKPEYYKFRFTKQ